MKTPDAEELVRRLIRERQDPFMPPTRMARIDGILALVTFPVTNSSGRIERYREYENLTDIDWVEFMQEARIFFSEDSTVSQ